MEVWAFGHLQLLTCHASRIQGLAVSTHGKQPSTSRQSPHCRQGSRTPRHARRTAETETGDAATREVSRRKRLKSIGLRLRSLLLLGIGTSVGFKACKVSANGHASHLCSHMRWHQPSAEPLATQVRINKMRSQHQRSEAIEALGRLMPRRNVVLLPPRPNMATAANTAHLPRHAFPVLETLQCLLESLLVCPGPGVRGVLKLLTSE